MIGEGIPLLTIFELIADLFKRLVTGNSQTKFMNKLISRIPNDVQDRNSVAWKKLCDYIDRLAETNMDEFSPAEELGPELFAQIYTLPESIAKLKHIKKIWLYGS